MDKRIPINLQMKSSGGENKPDTYTESNKNKQPSKEEIINQAINLHQKGKISEALKYYQYCINNGFNDHRVFCNYGTILKGLGNLKKAEILLRKSIDIKSDFALAHYNLGNTLTQLNKLKEAELSMRKAIYIKPNYAKAYNNLGNLLFNLDKHKDAELSIRKAIEINPNLSEAHYSLGSLLINFGQLKEARVSLSRSIELNPDYGLAYRDLGICLYLMGEINSALKNIQKAGYIDPYDEGSKILLRFFQSNKSLTSKTNTRDIKTINLSENIVDSNLFIFNRPVEKELIECLYKVKARDQAEYQRPTYGDAKGSDYKLFEISDPIIKMIQEELTSISRDYVKSDILIADSFFTIFRSGGGLTSHDHLNKLDKINALNLAQKKFSLVYYLSVGDQNCKEPGILKLENPNHEILPNNGLIVVFPSSRRHSVFYKGEKDRIIIGINFYII